MLISSCDILRQLFKSRWKGITGREWDNSEEDGKYFSEGVGKKILKDAVKHQKLKIQSGNIELWDMTLLSFVLQNFGDPILYKEENEHVRTLKNLRNDQKHNSDNELTTEEYEVAVTDFIKVLEALKVRKKDTDKIIKDAQDTSKDFTNLCTKKEKITESTTWDQLSNGLKTVLANKYVIYQGNRIKLRCFIEEYDDLVNFLDGKILVQLANGENTPCILNDNVPTRLHYYVDRTVTSRNILKIDVLKEECEDVFLIEGMERHQLSSLVPKKESTDVSGNQLARVTSRFILLEYEPDFYKICKLATTPVHWVQYKNGALELIRSSGSVKTLQKHIHTVEYMPRSSDMHSDFIQWDCMSDHVTLFSTVKHHHQDSFREEEDEQDSLSKIDEEDSFKKDENELASSIQKVVVIADSPGMGKTCLLGNIAHQIMRKQPIMPVRFIVLKEFVDALAKKKINIESIVKEIAEQSSEYEFGRKLVENALKTEECVLLFDGLDEVLPNQMTAAKKILQTASELHSVKVFVATRLHLRDEIENTLHVLAYTMQPFNESNQTNFLAKYWKSKGATDNESLIKFTEECVTQLNSKMRDDEKSIAGIPLQCRMIAETYKDKAIRCSKAPYQGPDSVVMADSIFGIYERHMELRFKKIRKQKSLFTRLVSFLTRSDQYEVIKNVHMYFALELLFPDHADEFKALNSKSIELHQLCGLGIIEATNSNDIRFVHRTFAEYLVAMLAHQIIINRSHPGVLLSAIFKLSPNKVYLITPFLSKYQMELKSFEFNFPVICYFVNGLLKSQPLTNLPFDYDAEALPFYHASAFHNYDTIPFILSRLVQPVTETNSVETYEELTRVVFYVAALHSGLELFKLFCSAIDITQIQFLILHEDGRGFSEFTLTPLHVAVGRGHYSLVEYLLNKFQDNLANLRYFIYFCIHKSAKDTQVIVKDKIQIIKLLSKINHDWIDEQLPSKSTPLMQKKVHVQLLQCLIEERPNLDACDEDGNTVLHRIPDRNKLTGEEYDMILNCLIQHGFQYINKPGENQETPLHAAVAKVELLIKTLDSFLSKGGDLNAVDKEGDSVLFYAIRHRQSSDLISMLINRGSNTNHRNRDGQNALHISFECRNFKALEYFLNTHNINVNHQDNYGDTPLHHAVRKSARYEELEPMQLLLMKLGANVNAVNNSNRTPFLESFEHGEGLSLTVIKEMETRGLHITKPVASEALTSVFLNIDTNDADAPKPLESLVYLMNKGGEVEWQTANLTIPQNFWKWEALHHRMQNIIEHTHITTELLTQAQTHAILTQQEMITLQELEDSVKSKRFYEMVQDKPASFERVYVILRSEEQIDAVEELIECLSELYYPTSSSSYAYSDNTSDSS